MNDAYAISKPLYKSVAAALIFSAILGPVGLLYASFWGGFVMILIGIVVVCSKLLFPIILFWIICCIWGVRAVEVHNRKIIRALLKQQTISP
jgi:uncharacterized RDD family membrane protein YckC